MATAADSGRHRHRPLSCFLHSSCANLSSILTPKLPQPSSQIHHPLFLPELSLLPALPLESTQSDSLSPNQSKTQEPTSSPSSIKNMRSPEPSSGLPSTVRMSKSKGRGPAFVGQVFSMCDLSGTGLMAVSTHFDIPFLSKRTPEWLKKMFAAVTKSERNGPVFRFFMDLGDAVSYVKQLNIPSGVVGACRLDIAYEHFKEKPHLFQFIPNEKQVKAANKLLKTMPRGDGRKKMEGVPVFSAQNLDIAIATEDSIKWYTPYFFDKNILDNILEESVDQHFHALIQTRHLQRRRNVLDDDISAEAADEMAESMWEMSEVQEMMDEIGGDHPGIPLSVISKAAEIQLLYAVDRVLLGNRWLRKATGIQPKFPYVVDSFEKKSAASLLRANPSSHCIANSEFRDDVTQSLGSSKLKRKDNFCDEQGRMLDFRFPFGDWSSHPWLKQQPGEKRVAGRREDNCTSEHRRQAAEPSPFLPKITMVGVSTGESVRLSKDNLKKTILNVRKELERVEEGNLADSASDQFNSEDRDPLFVANVGDYYSSIPKTSSARWVRRL